MPEEAVLIQALLVERDENGFWTHPAWPQDGDENAIQKGWFAENGLEYCMVEMEYDGQEELMEKWVNEGLCDCTAWDPSPAPGDGWFGWELALTSWGILSLPFAYSEQAKYIIFSN